MEHAEALEQIEIAAAEPDGLERLMAGDTPEGAAVAGHLAGCPACMAELAAIRRVAALAREVIVSEPDPALRDRTLAFVRSMGVDRSASAGAATPAEPVVRGAPSAPVVAPAPAPVSPTAPAAFPLAARRRRLLAPLAAIAASLLLVGVLGYAAGGGFGPSAGEYESEVAVLQEATQTSMRIGSQPDAESVALASTNGGAATGTLLFSPSTGELVMVADGLAPLPAGAEYGCWVEVDGERRRIGVMYSGGGMWAWSGTSDQLAALPPGAVFGVSLVPADGGAAQPLLTGSL